MNSTKNLAKKVGVTEGIQKVCRKLGIKYSSLVQLKWGNTTQVIKTRFKIKI